MKTNQKENRRNVRVDVSKPLKVTMGSIGSEMRYEMQTSNLSVNGFFLEFESPGRFPFTPASIMEVWMELGEGNSIFFNGKMARVVYSETTTAQGTTGPGIAIKIVQIETNYELTLQNFIQDQFKQSQKNEASSESEKAAS